MYTKPTVTTIGSFKEVSSHFTAFSVRILPSSLYG